MFRVSSKLDYALRALVHLAAAGETACKVQEIAAVEQIPARFLGATLTEVRRAGLVHSRRGGAGGFSLARPAGEITVADVVRAVDGDLIDPPGLARGQGPREQVWSSVVEALEDVLGAVSLADLAAARTRSDRP